MAAKETFKTILLKAGKTATGIIIPPEIVERLNSGKKPAIKVTINGFTYRNTVAVMGGDYMVGVSAENRESAKIKGGDEIDVTIELDTEPRVLELPAEFETELNKNEKAKKNFETKSYSTKKGLIAPILLAKTEETKNRNILKVIDALNK